MWAPLGLGRGCRLTAQLSPRGPGHILAWHFAIRRTYTDGSEIGGTAARADLAVWIAAAPGHGWRANLTAEYTPPFTLSGPGDLLAAVAAMEREIVPFAKRITPVTLAGRTAIPAALHVPSGGLLLSL